jgi:hypothetical protein
MLSLRLIFVEIAGCVIGISQADLGVKNLLQKVDTEWFSITEFQPIPQNPSEQSINHERLPSIECTRSKESLSDASSRIAKKICSTKANNIVVRDTI